MSRRPRVLAAVWNFAIVREWLWLCDLCDWLGETRSMRLVLLIVCLIAELVAAVMLIAGWHESLAVALIAVGNTVALVLAARPRRRIG